MDEYLGLSNPFKGNYMEFLLLLKYPTCVLCDALMEQNIQDCTYAAKTFECSAGGGGQGKYSKKKKKTTPPSMIPLTRGLGETELGNPYPCKYHYSQRGRFQKTHKEAVEILSRVKIQTPSPHSMLFIFYSLSR